MEKRNFNEALKQRELREREENARRAGDQEMTLDDTDHIIDHALFTWLIMH